MVFVEESRDHYDKNCLDWRGRLLKWQSDTVLVSTADFALPFQERTERSVETTERAVVDVVPTRQRVNFGTMIRLMTHLALVNGLQHNNQ